MRDKRMFSKEITESDAFPSLPDGAKVLYFYLNMNADDDGFCNSPRRVMDMVKAKDDDMKVLISKRFILWFDEAGVAVVKHWKIHNYISKDRYRETKYREIMAEIYLDDNKAYSMREKPQAKIEPAPQPQARPELPQLDYDTWVLLARKSISMGLIDRARQYADSCKLSTGQGIDVDALVKEIRG